jgi:ubiquinone/menaquinone biosynthesis C-methylase UbiE
MLDRILEPEVMDTVDEARDYDAMDHSTVNRVFVEDFLKVWNGIGPILDVGTGTAQIPIEFCKKSPHGNVVAIDLADEMLKIARQNVSAAGYAGRIRVQLVNARGMPFADGMFPAVISNSIVHHIPEPATCFVEMKRVSAHDAQFFVRDLLRPDDEKSLRNLVDQYAGDANDHQRKMFGESLHAALTLDEVRALVAAIGFATSTVTQTSDRHWTWSV